MVYIHTSRWCCWEWSKVMAVKIQALTGGDGRVQRMMSGLSEERK